jgi:lipopolysaccharide export system permease protein
MKTNDELIYIIAEKKKLVKSAMGSPNFLDLKKNMIGTQIELYSRYVTFYQIILFILVGFSLGMKRGRGTTGNNSLIAIAVLLSHFIIYFVGISISKKGHIDPFLASFLPCLILFLLGIHYFKKLDWAS